MPRRVRVLCALCNDWRDGDEVTRNAGILSSFCFLAEVFDVVGEGGARRPVGAHARCTLAVRCRFFSVVEA